MEKSSTMEYGISDHLLYRDQVWDTSYYKATVRYNEGSKEGIGSGNEKSKDRIWGTL